MTQLERLKVRLDGETASDALLLDLLESAKNIVLEVRFPFSAYPTHEVVYPVLDTDGNPTGETVTVLETYLEPRYNDVQLRIAIELYDRLGAEGQLGHSENGISRSWSSADVSSEVLSKITPKVGLV